MPKIGNPKSVLIAEPNLLIPGKKPVGPVVINRSIFNTDLVFLFRTPVVGIGEYTYTLTHADKAELHGWCEVFSSYVGLSKAGGAGSNPNLDIGTTKRHNGAFTIFTRVKRLDDGRLQQIMAGDSNTNSKRDYQFRFNTSNQLEFIYFVSNSVYGVTTTETISGGVWHNIAVSMDSSRVKIFVDGIKLSDAASAGNCDSDSPRVGIGVRWPATTGTSYGEDLYGTMEVLVFCDYVVNEHILLAATKDPYVGFDVT